MAERTERKLLLSRWGQLKAERESWMSHWKEISDYLLPRSGRFFINDRNRGEKRHNNILDNTGTRAARARCGDDGRYEQPGPALVPPDNLDSRIG